MYKWSEGFISYYMCNLGESHPVPAQGASIQLMKIVKGRATKVPSLLENKELEQQAGILMYVG